MSTDEPQSPIAKDVGRTLRERRFVAGLSQRGLAAHLRVSRSRVARLENSADTQTLGAVDHALRGCGFELVVRRLDDPEGSTDGLSPDEPAGPGPDLEPVPWSQATAVEVLPTDAAGRRFPAHARVKPFVASDRWWWVVRHPRRRASERPTWTWTRILAEPLVRLPAPPTRPRGPRPGPEPGARDP